MQKLFKRPILQHFGMISFIAIGTLCFSIITDWPENFDLWLVRPFQTSLFTALLAIPAYINLLVAYKGQILKCFPSTKFFLTAYKRWWLYFFLFVSIILSIVFGIVYEGKFSNELWPWSFFDLAWYTYAILILLTTLCSASVEYVAESALRARRIEQLERKEAIQKQREAERKLEFIKRQIRPHFLFNTLANLQILAINKSDKLPGLINQLSNLLRHLIYLTQERTTQLSYELEFIKSYVNLRRLSLEERTDIRLEIDASGASKGKIAPMILLLFVENCFKHFNKHEKNGSFIHIKIFCQDNWLTLTTANTFDPDYIDSDKSEGIGQTAAIEHLQLVYGDTFSLERSIEASSYIVHLKIPLET